MMSVFGYFFSVLGNYRDIETKQKVLFFENPGPN